MEDKKFELNDKEAEKVTGGICAGRKPFDPCPRNDGGILKYVSTSADDSSVSIASKCTVCGEVFYSSFWAD